MKLEKPVQRWTVEPGKPETQSSEQVRPERRWTAVEPERLGKTRPGQPGQMRPERRGSG